MRAAVLEQFGAPSFGQFEEPRPGDGEVVVDVLAAGVNHIDLAKASGRFYLGPPPLPSVVGTDAVGRAPDGRLVYLDAAVPPFGSLAERTLAREADLIDVPEGVDPAVAAALGNAGLAAWTGLGWRGGLREGETVLVLGATGVVGRIAVQAARLLGAGRVIAAGRDPRGLERATELGADATADLTADPETYAPALAGADVILDTLWGPPAAAALEQAAEGVRLVQIGQLACLTAELAAPMVRSRAADIRGHAIFQAPYDVRAAGMTALATAAIDGRLQVDLERVALETIEDAWARQAAGTSGVKLVVVP